MSEKRFIVENDNNEVSIKDKVKDNYPFALAYEHIDDGDNLIQECLSLVVLLNEQQATIKQLESDKAIAEDYANIFEMENVKLRKKLNNYKATVLGFIWIMEQNGRISGKDDKFVKDLFKELENE